MIELITGNQLRLRMEKTGTTRMELAEELNVTEGAIKNALADDERYDYLRYRISDWLDAQERLSNE